MSVPHHLSLACGDYDINRALITGEVVPQGLSLTVLTLPSPERHARMARHREFDACELSMATLLAMRGAGETGLVAIPAFPHRRMRHSYIFVPEQSPIRDPSELNGTRVGLRTWQTTAGLWARGILQDDHGIDLRSIEWMTQDAEDIPMAHAGAYAITRVPAGSDVVDLLRTGRLDAAIYPEQLGGRHGIRRLFEDSKAAEIAYHRRTGHFPIMHTVVLRRELVDAMPWIARELLLAFRRSKELAFDGLRDPRRVSLAWLREAVEEQEAVLGPDPWAYEYSRNAATLETMIRYAHEQGFVAEPFPATDLFVPSTIDEVPTYV